MKHLRKDISFHPASFFWVQFCFVFSFFLSLIALHVLQLLCFLKSSRICWSFCFLFFSRLSVFCVCFGPCGRNLSSSNLSDEKKKSTRKENVSCIVSQGTWLVASSIQIRRLQCVQSFSFVAVLFVSCFCCFVFHTTASKRLMPF